MTIVTHDMRPPFRAVRQTSGAWPDRFHWWEVVDAEGRVPHPDVEQAWCERIARALNGQEKP